MTRVLSGADVAAQINEAHPGASTEWNATDVWVEPASLLQVAGFLKESSDLDFSFLTAISAVDYVDHFELVYHLLSMRQNHSVVLKTRRYGREKPVIDSLTPVWKGANLQEREIWDLMGVHFEGHPNMKRILLWEDFPGHPLRKDFVR
jgi:NADH-quinone oxidoreductase subunit C